MLLFYKILTYLSSPLLMIVLLVRSLKGKEDYSRLSERKGSASIPRPKEELIWIHAASVGEAQSALILIEKLSSQKPNIQFLITSGTKTSAELMKKRLPANAFHQYLPLDNPFWAKRFITHWKPNLVLWMESELWPNMLFTLKKNNIPVILINARLSENSFKRWSFLEKSASKILRCFNLILCQTHEDQRRFKILGAANTQVTVTNNLKYSASPLPINADDLEKLKKAINERPLWVYASTHDGEEALAARIHTQLKEHIPNLLSIIVPRHPERRGDIQNTLKTMGLNIVMRGEGNNLPAHDTDIYVADTLGELGLFYALSPIAMIGRSFSHDGGGGHNPIEAAQLSCAVLTGPHIQYQTQLFNDMLEYGAVKQVMSEDELLAQLKVFLSNQKMLGKFITNAERFAEDKTDIVDNVITHLSPYLNFTQKDVQ